MSCKSCKCVIPQFVTHHSSLWVRTFNSFHCQLFFSWICTSNGSIYVVCMLVKDLINRFKKNLFILRNSQWKIPIKIVFGFVRYLESGMHYEMGCYYHKLPIIFRSLFLMCFHLDYRKKSLAESKGAYKKHCSPHLQKRPLVDLTSTPTSSSSRLRSSSNPDGVVKAASDGHHSQDDSETVSH